MAERMSPTTLSLVAAAAVTFAVPAFASSVTNAPTAGTIIFWGPAASGGNQSYGLVFTAPQAVLDDYSLTVEDDGASFPFVSQVYAWNGTETVGSALFTSAVQTTTSSLTTFTFSPDVTLTAGDEYIAFVTNDPGGTSLGGAGTDTGEMQQGSGPATFMFAVGDPTASGAWHSYSENASFNADFSAVPEPAAWSLMLAGFAGLGVALRARRGRSAAA